MAVPQKPLDPNVSGSIAGLSGTRPGTESSGVIFLEYVNVERKISSVWTQLAGNVPATFEPLTLHVRYELQTWSHKPLLCLWMLPNTTIDDGDRVIRSDGSHWYIRGAPLVAPAGTHIAALAERATEDKLFAPISASEPS